MAKTPIFTINGSVALPTGFNLDSQTMRISETQNMEDVTHYQGTAYNVYLGVGSTQQETNITGYPFKGSTGGSNPGFGQMNGTTGATGGSAVLTLDTGVTATGPQVIGSVSTDHSRLVAGSKCTLMMRPSGDIVIAWASS